jgi:hypothetical protein
MLGIVAGLAACASPAPQVSPEAGGLDAMPSARAAPTDCHVAPDPGQPQYIIGYGSLMQDESRKRTSPQAGPARPVQVSGYRRGWFAKGDPLGFSTTYLGVVPEAASRLNAVIYRVEVSDLMATDQREALYCRASVPGANVLTLEKERFQLPQGQFWIYTNWPQWVAIPSARYPIVQSYVDIFVSGCLEQEQRFELDGFARQCLATTSDWSAHWINDRLYPRRPFIFQPKARQIDALLSQQVPEYFSKVRIQ